MVDDYSTDSTARVVEKFIKRDSRIRALKTEVNGGPYVARNLALQVATGEFVTCNDSDDWSHPEKIERQVVHLLKQKKIVANTSQQVRATSSLKFFRRGNYGHLIFENMSSLMFRRQQVLDAIGFFDSVRFGADNEFKWRLKRHFGKESIVDLETGPLSFQRQSSDSLTGSISFGYHGFYMGARKAYHENYNKYHASTKDFYYDFPQKIRPFPIPEPMFPDRETNKNSRRKFDVLIASDFRSDNTMLKLIINLIKEYINIGARIGLTQMYQYDLNPTKKTSDKIRELISFRNIQLLVFGEQIQAKKLFVANCPPVLAEKQCFLPDIKATEVIAITEKPLNLDTEDAIIWKRRIKGYFGTEGVWIDQTAITSYLNISKCATLQ